MGFDYPALTISVLFGIAAGVTYIVIMLKYPARPRYKRNLTEREYAEYGRKQEDRDR